MQAIRNYYDNFCSQIEKNTRLSELGFYGISAGVLIYACYRKKPFTRFVKASDIPNDFIKQKIQQRAILSKIESSPNGPILFVRHRPPIPLPSISSKTLPVKISGVQVDTNGLTWLETFAAGKNKELRFVPLTNTSDKYVDAQVILFDAQNDDRPVDLGKALLSIGFATTTSIPASIDLKHDSFARSYFNDLKSKEQIAKFFRRGRWASLPDEPFQIRRKLESLIIAVKTQERKVPPLVRASIKLTGNYIKSKAKKKLQPVAA